MRGTHYYDVPSQRLDMQGTEAVALDNSLSPAAPENVIGKSCDGRASHTSEQL